MTVEREKLELPAGHDGAAWHYRYVGQHFPRHTHAELEMNLVLRGRAAYLLDDRKYELHRNSLVWLFPSQRHILLEQSSDHEMWIFVWRPQLVRKVGPSVLRQHTPKGNFLKQIGESLARRLNTLFAEVESAQPDVSRFNTGLAYALLTAWAAFQDTGTDEVGTEVHPAVESAARLLRNDPTLSVESVAKRAGLSASRLSRLFHEQTGVALVDYRNRQRLDHFLALFGNGLRRTMTEAALEAGFGSYPQFHRVFTRLKGCSPAEYRRKL